MKVLWWLRTHGINLERWPRNNQCFLKTKFSQVSYPVSPLHGSAGRWSSGQWSQTNYRPALPCKEKKLCLPHPNTSNFKNWNVCVSCFGRQITAGLTAAAKETQNTHKYTHIQPLHTQKSAGPCPQSNPEEPTPASSYSSLLSLPRGPLCRGSPLSRQEAPLQNDLLSACGQSGPPEPRVRLTDLLFR